MREIRVDLLVEDIQQGKKMNCNLCPVARAATRAIQREGIEGTAHVSYSAIGVLRTPMSTAYSVEFATPPEVDDFIFAFDHGTDVKPFSFTMVEKKMVEKKRE